MGGAVRVGRLARRDFRLEPGEHGAGVDRVERRTRALVALGRAPDSIVEQGLRELQRATFFSEAIQDADWVIEAIQEDVGAKQKLFVAIEDAVSLKRSSALLERPRAERDLRPDAPPRPLPRDSPAQPAGADSPRRSRAEARTSPASITRAVDYLRALGRFPIVLKKAIPGYVVGRVSAAVWRSALTWCCRA